MKDLISSNIYEFEDVVVVCGTCLPNVDKIGFEKVMEMSENIYSVCLESHHMNLVAHKLASILRLNKVKKMIFVSVDKSPHCVQLHYIRNELIKIIKSDDLEIKSYVSKNGELVELSYEIISLSKNMSKLVSLYDK